MHSFRTPVYGFAVGLTKGLKELLVKPAFFCMEKPKFLTRASAEGMMEKNRSARRKSIRFGEKDMNRENKRKQFEKGYYKTHPCTDSFTCKVCGRTVVPEDAGSEHRNHCNNCLSSLHVDVEPGDRASDCGGIMEPISVWVRKGGEWAIIHRCRRCGELCSNRVAADDNPMKLMSIALKPLCEPPFPIERIEEMTRLMGGEGSLE